MSRVDNLSFPQPLKADFTHPSPYVVSAYSTCYLAERVIKPIQNRSTPRDETVNLPELVNIRILGHLLSQSPFLSDRAISEVARAIIRCRANPEGTDETDVEALNKLGELYKNYLLLPFRKFKGQAPLSTSPSSDASSDASSPLSERSFQFMEDEVDQMLAETPKSGITSKRLAMQREDHRCIVTGMLGLQYAVDLRRRTGETYKDAVTCLHVCHIFAGSTIMNRGKVNEGDSDGEDDRWALLKSLGYIDIANDFATADHVHSLTNVMMMAFNLRDAFDRLDMWFEPIENEYSSYRLCSIWMLPYGLVAGQEVTFRSTDPHRLPLPNREYLRIHAACCRVAQLSGACILFDELEQDMDFDPDP